MITKGGSGGTPSTSNSSFYNGTIPFLSITDISNSNGFIFDTEKHITEEALNSSTAWIVPKESVSLAMYASVGKVAILKENIATSQAFYNMIFKTLELRDYCFQYLKKMEINNEWLPYISTGTQANLNAEKVQNLKLKVPLEESEQRKVGQLFYKLDSLITLHQRKLIFLKSHRFQMSVLFCYSWEQRKVKEIAERFDNLRIPVAASQRESGSIPYYGANGIQDYVNGFTHNGEFVLVAEDGANDLKNYPVQYVNGKIWVNNHAHVLQSNKNNNTMFLKYLIGSTDIESLLVGGGRAKLNAEVLMSIDLTLPNKKEQKHIAIFFDRLDSLITLHQRKQL